MRSTRLILAASIAAALAGTAHAESWWAQPLVVHEWGVQQFDYARALPVTPDLPAFMYTDAKPGAAQALADKKVKDLPPDSGIRLKPILYFYPAERALSSPVPAGVEMRFTYGHANAWYPQVSTYRTPSMTAGAQEPDWEAWRKANANRAFRTASQPAAPVPDDPRMELVWSRLNVSRTLPAGTKLADVPAGDWIEIARQVNSAYVSNGKETEKFLFYEGATHETPSIAILPGSDGFAANPAAALHIANVAETPIYNVFAIYHHDKKTWLAYTSVLEPIKPVVPNSTGGSGNSIATLPLPDFEKNTNWIDDKDLPRLTTDRLLSALTEGGALSINRSLRDPADPQGPTTSSTLYPDEAAALEKIWHDDLFNAEGLTIVYREAPAALDKAMPLNLYTDMYNYVVLSRCGMVICKNVATKDAPSVYSGTLQFSSVQTPNGPMPYGDAKSRASVLPTLKQNRLLTRGAIAYYERLGHTPKEFAELEAALDEK